MRLLVTGGAGFIGSHIVRRLLDEGHLVSVVDDLSTGRPENLPPSVPLHRISILDSELELRCLGLDAIIHAAAQTSVAASVGTPLVDADINVIGSIHVAMAAAKASVRRIIYLSSAAVYGAPMQLPVPESHPILPSSPYGLSKWTAEQYIRLVAEQFGLTWIALRLANVYGPRQAVTGEAGVIARWCDALIREESLCLHGDGNQTRDFIYVADVAQAVCCAVEQTYVQNLAMNIGTGQQTSLHSLLQRLVSAWGQTPSVSSHPHRDGDILHSVLDNTTARQRLGWQARHSLQDGLAETLRFFFTASIAPKPTAR